MDVLRLQRKMKLDREVGLAPDLCDRFQLADLDRLGQWAWDGYDRDKKSRFKWEKRVNAAMDLAMQVQKAKNFPWPGAANVAFPLITIGALQFSAQSYQNIIQGQEVVRYRVIGEDRGGLASARALRVSAHMSWQVLEQDQSWEEQHDLLLINLAIVGAGFIKTYYNPSKGYTVGEFVPARDLVVDYGARSLCDAARKTQEFSLYRNEIHERVIRGVYRDIRNEEWYTSRPPLPEDREQRDNRRGLSPVQTDEDTPFQMLEQHRWFDLDQDGYAEPYTITIERNSKKVCRLVARWEGEEAIERNARGEIIRIRAEEYYTKYPFIPNPESAIYDLGFGTLLGPLNESVSSIINQVIDNGTLQNSIGGFLGRGMKIRGGNYTMAPFEFKRVDSTGDDIRKNLVMFEPRQPPQMLLSLLTVLIDYTNRVAGTVDTMVGENPGQNTPAQTYQGMQERGMQIYAWIFKRIWRAMKDEFRVRYCLNRQFLRIHQKFGEGGGWIRREDYLGDPDQIAPVADPNLPSSVMRLQQALALRQAALSAPGYNMEEVERNYLRALRVPNPAQVYPGIGKTPPLPNFRLQIEQAKLKSKEMELQYQQRKWANELMEERRINSAKIANLEAQSAKLLKEGNAAEMAGRLRAFEISMNALQEHGKMLNQRIGALNASTQGNPDEGRLGSVAQAASDTGVQGDAEAPAGGAEGAVGAGAGGQGSPSESEAA